MLNLKVRPLRLNSGLHIVLLLPRPLTFLGFLRLVPLVLQSLSLRRKRNRHQIWFSPLIQRNQSCLPPTLRFLYLLNQWLTMPSQSGRHIVVKSLTQFFGDPLRHSVKSVEEDPILSSETAIGSSLRSVTEKQNMPSDAPVVSSSSPRKPLIRDRLPPRPSAPMSPSLAQRKETTGTD